MGSNIPPVCRPVRPGKPAAGRVTGTRGEGAVWYGSGEPRPDKLNGSIAAADCCDGCCCWRAGEATGTGASKSMSRSRSVLGGCATVAPVAEVELNGWPEKAVGEPPSKSKVLLLAGCDALEGVAWPLVPDRPPTPLLLPVARWPLLLLPLPALVSAPAKLPPPPPNRDAARRSRSDNGLGGGGCMAADDELDGGFAGDAPRRSWVA